MGTGYSNLVKACLTCLDDAGNKRIDDWRTNFHELDRELDYKVFRRIVLSFLWDVNKAFAT